MNWLKDIVETFIDKQRQDHDINITYSNNGVKEIMYISNGEELYYKIDNKNRLIESKRLDKEKNIKRLNKHQFNANDLISEMLFYIPTKGYVKTTKSYTSKGILKEQLIGSSMDNEIWKIEEEYLCKYNDDGFITDEIIRNYLPSGRSKIEELHYTIDINQKQVIMHRGDKTMSVNYNVSAFLAKSSTELFYSKKEQREGDKVVLVSKNEKNKWEERYNDKGELVEEVFCITKSVLYTGKHIDNICYKPLLKFEYKYDNGRVVEQLITCNTNPNQEFFFKKVVKYKDNNPSKTIFYGSIDGVFWKLLWKRPYSERCKIDLPKKQKECIIQSSKIVREETRMQTVQSNLNFNLKPNVQDVQLIQKIKSIYERELGRKVRDEEIISQALKTLVKAYGDEIKRLHYKQYKEDELMFR